MAQRWYQKASVQSSIVGGVFLVGASILGILFSGVIHQRDQLLEERKSWHFSEELFRNLPGDIDFLARHLRVDKKHGESVSVHGPRLGDELKVKASHLQSALSQGQGPSYQVLFTVSGRIAGTEMIPSPMPIGPMGAEMGERLGPVAVGRYELFIYVERVEIDSAFITVARHTMP
jgi:hypothetical protein